MIEVSGTEPLSQNGIETETPPQLPQDIITGRSGQQYRAVDLIREMRGDQEAVLFGLLQPIIPALTRMMKASVEEDEEGAAQINVVIDLGGIASAVVEHRVHRAIIAAAYLPTGDRTFRAEDVEARIADIDFTIEECVEVLRSFFGSAASSFQNIFGGSLGDLVTTGRNASAANSAGKKRLK